ncbi:hypothetical protein AGLY_000758 [Aphis glycines]|uniref:Uncharacterized protein n=1 Tax=Aphis glycines TaxID=307491 RepID=A0A6G0U7V8_APHGL|nr:hypothetical protein AGLY_000758 [Aphis glycines]
MTQSTAPGRFMSVAKNTISSPCKVVIDLCATIKCSMTCSNPPCHLHEAPGHGQVYGRHSHNSSCSTFSECNNDTGQPEDEYLQGNMTVEATFSMAKLRMFPSGPRHVGQQLSFGRHVLQTKCPLWHCNIGALLRFVPPPLGNKTLTVPTLAVGLPIDVPPLFDPPDPLILVS